MEMKPLVVVVDDDESFRSFVARVLENAGFNTAECASIEEAQQTLDPQAASCILLDLHFPEATGIDLQRWLKSKDCSVPVIFISGRADVPQAVDAMQMGAFHFLQKPVTSERVLGLVTQAVQESHRRRELAVGEADIRRRIATLTPREVELLGHIQRGQLSKQIANELGLSPRTVEHHRSSILSKMGAANAADLVRMVCSVDFA